MTNQGDDRNNILLEMHKFYAEEARNQRSMMWDTVKWFTPILTGIHAGWFWIFIDESLNEYYPLLLAIAGVFLSVICLILLRSFYKTNLIYITMFSKIEDDLAFEKRTIKNFFSNDNEISYWAYLKDRLQYKQAKKFVEDTTKMGTMHLSMQHVFHLLLIGFLFEVSFVIWRISEENTMHTAIEIAAILLALAGAYFLALGLKVKQQYSEDLIKELKLREKGFLILADVKQEKRAIYLGLILLTVAAILQLYVIVVPTSG